MKKFRLILLIALLASGVSVYAWKPRPRKKPIRRCVSVPLDGGILAVLGAAGITYFLVRRKSKKKEQ